MYNPPAKPERSFSADYPQGAPADASGRLIQDIDGRPLRARYIAGRRMVGDPDRPLTPQEVVAGATEGMGRYPQVVSSSEIGRDVGRLKIETDRRSGHRDYHMLWNRGLSPRQAEKVIAHETGHLIDDMAGHVPTAGLKTELQQVYNTLNTGQERARHLTRPQHLGYRGAAVDRELVAEAIRAYMADPNYLKTVAPRTAKAIRDAVNAHPEVSKIVQFNSLGDLGLFGPLLRSPMQGIDTPADQ